VEHNLVDKSGAWYSYKGDRIGQGRDNVREFLKQNPDMAKEIDRALRDILLARKPAVAEQAEELEAAEEAEA
jgi:recombination protein RecA